MRRAGATLRSRSRPWFAAFVRFTRRGAGEAGAAGSQVRVIRAERGRIP